jgi:pre-mRNA-processing factor 19
MSTMDTLQNVAGTTLYLDFTVLDVFTRQRYQGNPLAVVHVPDTVSGRITKEAKQRIAREFNLSETVFIHIPNPSSIYPTDPMSSKSCRVDIFTVNEELPFAGHPVIGAASMILDHLHWKIDALELKAGTFPIRHIYENDHKSSFRTTTKTDSLVQVGVVHDLHIHSRTLADIIAGTTTMPLTGPRTAIAAALSSDETIRQAELHAPVVSIVQGMTALLVKLPSLAHLALVSTASRLHFDETIQDLLLDKGPWGRSFCYRYYYIDQDEEESGNYRSGGMGGKSDATVRCLRARMVELATEDPATGSAACTLGAYLAIHNRCHTSKMKFKITQGVEMNRRSDIVVEVRTKMVDGVATVDELALSGMAVIASKGSIYVQEK